MKTKILKNENDYNLACERLYNIINSTSEQIEPESDLGEEAELLSLIIEKYESEHYRLDAPTPIEAIKFRMEQMNLKQADIAPLFGGKTRVSEVLNGKRSLSLKTITLLNRYLGIPLESLIQGDKNIKLDSDKKEKILNISAIRNYVANSRIAML